MHLSQTQTSMNHIRRGYTKVPGLLRISAVDPDHPFIMRHMNNKHNILNWFRYICQILITELVLCAYGISKFFTPSMARVSNSFTSCVVLWCIIMFFAFVEPCDASGPWAPSGTPRSVGRDIKGMFCMDFQKKTISPNFPMHCNYSIAHYTTAYFLFLSLFICLYVC